MKPIRTSFLLAIAATLHIGGAAQQATTPAAQEAPTIKVTTEEVILDLVIRDKKGKPVKDLTQDDIVVTDDGVKQKITSFRLVEGREAIEKGAKVPLDSMRQLRLVTLVFEPLNADSRQIAKQAALDLIKGDQGQNVFYSVFVIQNRLFPLQEFTNDRQKLRKAIELAVGGQFTQYAQETDRIRSSVRQMLERPEVQQTPPPPSGNAAPTPEQTAALGSQAVEQRLAQIMSEMVRFDFTVAQTEHTRLSVSALLALVKAQYTMPGRKSVLYFSEGMWLPPHLDEPFRSVLSTANRANVTFYSIHTGGVQTWAQTSASTDQVRKAAQASREDITREDGRVTIDAIRSSDNVENSMRNNVQLKMRELAESTGGFLIADSNDLRTPLRQINEEVNSYYEVSYNPGIQSYDGRFRKTSVEVARKDLVVHSRDGYFALPSNARGPAVLPYEFALMKALQANPFPKDVEFRSSALRFAQAAEGIHGSVLVEVPMSKVVFTEDKTAQTYKARLSVLAMLKNQAGEVVEKFSRDLPLSGPIAQIPQVKAGNFIYKEQFDVPPGRYTLEAAVIDHEAGKVGARKTAFVVPVKGKGVTMSSLTLVRNYQPKAADLQPGDPFQFDGGRITPTLGGTVYAVKGALLSMFFVVYPDPAIAEKPQFFVEYLVDGKTVGKAEIPLPAPDSQGRISYVMSSPAENMPPAEYQVKAVVKQGSSQAEENAFVTVAAAN